MNKERNKLLFEKELCINKMKLAVITIFYGLLAGLTNFVLGFNNIIAYLVSVLIIVVCVVSIRKLKRSLSNIEEQLRTKHEDIKKSEHELETDVL